MADDNDAPEEAEVPTSRSAQDEAKAMNALSDDRAGPAQVDADQVKAAMQALRADMEASRDAARKREAALAAIKLADADVAVVMDAADLARPAAERALREAGGKLEAALERLARPGAAVKA